jgi:thiol-disulfide isomerase/thioredoxin
LKLALVAGLAALPALVTACGPAETGGAGTGGGALPAEFNRPLTNLDGTQTTLAEHEGKVVLVNFWATWCAPCRVEIPWLIEFQEKYGPQGFVVVGVAMDDEGKSVVAPYTIRSCSAMTPSPSSSAA